MTANASLARKGWGPWPGLLVLGLLPLFLNSCSSSEFPAAAPENYPVGENNMPWNIPDGGALAGSPQFIHKPLKPKPGQGTTWGPYTHSPMSYTSFARGSTKPLHGVSLIWYNEKEAVERVTAGNYYTRKGLQRTAGGLVEWGMKSGRSTLKSYYWKDKRFSVGRLDSSYSIVLKSHARSRLEVVLTVDGLDVVDGKEADIKKRGYIIWPGQTLEVKGWRSSQQQVAKFVFSTVEGSYPALKHRTARNVGVVGLAVFPEKGIDPWNGYTPEPNDRFADSPFAQPPLERAHD